MKSPIIPPTTVITPAQLQLLIDAARKKSAMDELYIRLLSQAGLRPKEVETFTMSMFDPQNGVLRVPNVVTEVGHDREVPVQASLGKELSKVEVAPNEPIFAGKNWARRLNQIGQEAGIKISGMALRSSYLVYRLTQTMNLLQVAAEVGTSIDAAHRRSIVMPATPTQAVAWFAV